MGTILIGIAGGTGSGKTTLTRHLKEHFGDALTVIGHDSYYKRQEGKTYEERSRVNYDHPSAFDTELLIEHLKALKAGRSVQCPVYSYVEHNRHRQDGDRPSQQGHSCGGNPDFSKPRPAGHVRYQDLRGNRRGRAHSAPGPCGTWRNGAARFNQW